MTHKYLYDNEEQFYPISEASAIMGGVVTQGNTVWQDLEQIYSKAQQALNYANGATQIQGKLGVQVQYINTNYNDNTLIQLETAWNDDMHIPDSQTPYTWKKTVYYWSDTEIKTTYEICATALYPETQTMYAVTTQINSTDIGGPKDYTTNIQGIGDKNNIPTITWFNTFPGISPTATMGYMATRHRDAGKAWPADGGWHVALFAVYPTTSAPTT